jgi:hypothetical protein
MIIRGLKLTSLAKAIFLSVAEAKARDKQY